MITIEGKPVFTDYIKLEGREQWQTTVPLLHPESPQYAVFWSRETKKCIEGIWVKMFGKYRYMPGNLYYYGNYTLLQITTKNKVTKYEKPRLDDLEWEFALMSLEAKGFSGYELDEQYTSLELVRELEEEGISEPTNYIVENYPEVINPHGKLKKYRTPREAIRSLHNKPLGKCYMHNPTKNVMVVGSRGGGKSYYVGLAEVEYSWVFDGAKAYNKEFIDQLLTVELCVGASVKDKSAEMLAKVEASIDAKADTKLGRQFGVWEEEEADGTKHITPCPFYRSHKGNLNCPNKVNPFRYKYDVEQSGNWIEKGTGSKILHVNYSTNKGDGAQAAAGGRYAVSVVEEIGLCFAKGTKVRMFDLSVKKVEDVVIGDVVMGHDGTPRTVIQLHSGTDDLYKISQTFGDDYIVNSNHTLYLDQRCNVKSIKDDGIKKIRAKDFGSIGKYRKRTTYGIKSDFLNFPSQEVPVDPYWLGAWLGDGLSETASLIINDKDDKEILEWAIQFCNDNDLSYSTKKYKSGVIGFTFKKKKGFGVCSPIRTPLREMGLLNNKHIPDIYIHNSKEVRLELLAGLLDTDGYLQARGTPHQRFEFSQVGRPELCYSVKLLAESLGFRCVITSRKKTRGFGNSEISSRVQYRLSISGHIWEIPTKVARKQAPVIQHSKSFTRTSIKVAHAGYGEYYGFTLKENPLFLLEDSTVVHNCTNLKDIHISNASVVAREGIRFGVEWYIGTSGNIEYIQAAKEMFLNPQDYDIVAIDNKHSKEGKDGKIGFFLPFYLTLRQFKDKDGNTDFVAACKYINKLREDKKSSKNPKTIQGERMNRPVFINEMWVTGDTNLLPYDEASIREQQLMEFEKYRYTGTAVKLTWDSQSVNGVQYIVDHEAEPYFDYPINFEKRKDPKGCIVIYEFPQFINGVTPNDMYCFVGHDPYVEESYEGGGSVGSTYVMMNPKYIPLGFNGNTIVASYIDKPVNGLREYYENQEKLLAFYGNPQQGLWFEKNRGQDCRGYYIGKNKVTLLAQTPQHAQGVNIFQQNIQSYGYTVGNRIVKTQLAIWMRDWLLEETELKDGVKKNIERIPDIYLVRQMMHYNLDENFDAVDGFRGCIVGLRNNQVQVEAVANKKHDDRALRRLLNNPKIFRNVNRLSETTRAR